MSSPKHKNKKHFLHLNFNLDLLIDLLSLFATPALLVLVHLGTGGCALIKRLGQSTVYVYEIYDLNGP